MGLKGLFFDEDIYPFEMWDFVSKCASTISFALWDSGHGTMPACWYIASLSDPFELP